MASWDLGECPSEDDEALQMDISRVCRKGNLEKRLMARLSDGICDAMIPQAVVEIKVRVDA